MPKTKKISKKIKAPKTKVKVKVKKEKKAVKEIKKKIKYFESLGRRKTATSRVRLSQGGEKTFLINGRPLENYFPTFELQEIVLSPLKLMDSVGQFTISAKIKGGGLHGQAEAVRHGITKSLVLFNPDFRKTLKKAGYLTRDSRMRERKKFGLKRARRAPQWQKR